MMSESVLDDASQEGANVDSKYNGWTNWETWNWKLWLDNDETSYKASRRAAKNRAIPELAGWLEMEAETEMPTHQGPFADLIHHSLKAINWEEIAKSIKEE